MSKELCSCICHKHRTRFTCANCGCAPHGFVAKPNNTASITEDMFCKDCGWPVIHACCNDAMATTEPFKDNDWWGYCSNKGCKNHEGEPWNDSDPEFSFRIKG